MEEEQRKKREEERARREAQRKAQEEEKQRKEEERRKRLAEEKEREAERERKRKEKEEKAKAERREREERERKAREEREAKQAAERAAAAAKREQQEKEEREKRLAKEREEKEKVEKERLEKEKADKEARERLAQQQQQQRAAAASRPRVPTSPRNATPSGSSQRSPNNVAPQAKKILNKPAGPSVLPVIQPPRPQQQQHPRVSVVTNPTISPPPITPQISSHLPTPSTPMFPPTGMPPAALSPRIPFAPGSYVVPGPPIPQGPLPPLAPSALPRTFGNGASFEPGFGRAMPPPAPIAPPTPIAPPSRAVQNPLASPTQIIAASPSGRLSTADPGPVARPIAPIARPTEASGSGSTSPSRRSPSPKGVLGSAALMPDDDEVIGAPGGRRSAAPGLAGQGWGTASSRSSITDLRSPWGAPGSAFPSPRPPPPPIGSSLWSVPSTEWQTAPSFFGSPFTASSPPPHNGS